MDAKSRALTSLGMFALGFAIVFIISYFAWSTESDGRIFASVYLGLSFGWLIGGIIWGWTIVKKWFPPNPYEDKAHKNGAEQFIEACGLMLKFMLSIVVGFFAMAYGLIQVIIIFVKFIIRRVEAKKARQAAEAGTEQG